MSLTGKKGAWVWRAEGSASVGPGLATKEELAKETDKECGGRWRKNILLGIGRKAGKGGRREKEEADPKQCSNQVVHSI